MKHKKARLSNGLVAKSIEQGKPAGATNEQQAHYSSIRSFNTPRKWSTGPPEHLPINRCRTSIKSLEEMEHYGGLTIWLSIVAVSQARTLSRSPRTPREIDSKSSR